MPENFVRTLVKYDEALSEYNAEDCSLMASLSDKNLTFSIYSPSTNKYLSIESVDIGKFISDEAYTLALTDFFRDHQWLGLKYADIRLYYEASKSTLVPAALFLAEEQEQYASFNFAPNPNQRIFTAKIKNLDAYVVYTVPESVAVFLDKFYQKKSLRSHVGEYIDLVLLLNKSAPLKKKIFVNVRKSNVDIAVPENNKLLFYNSFEYKTREDFIYHVIFVLEQLNLNPNETELMLSGFIDKNSALFDIVFKYVKNIRFLKRSDTFKYGYLFDEIPEHYFFILLNGRLCE